MGFWGFVRQGVAVFTINQRLFCVYRGIYLLSRKGKLLCIQGRYVGPA